MTAETTAATGTVDTSAQAATTTDATATGSTTPPGSTDAPQDTEAAATTTDTDTDGKGDKPAEGEGDGEAAVPEAYEFDMPEGMELDQAMLDKATPVFKELGLTNEQASKLVGIYTEQLQAMGEGSAEQAEQWYAQRRAQEIAQANEDGIAAIKADKEIGGAQFDAIKSRVSDAVAAKGTPELKETFNSLGLGNNPEVVRFINRLIDYTPQDKGEGPGGAGGAAARVQDQIWPSNK